jgi:hypothetical protein
VALVVLAFLPIVSVAAMLLMKLNQLKGTNTTKSYRKAGSVAYSAVASVKTVLSLTAVTQMVESYRDATREAYRESLKYAIKLGLANGAWGTVDIPGRVLSDCRLRRSVFLFSQVVELLFRRRIHVGRVPLPLLYPDALWNLLAVQGRASRWM